MPTYEPLPQATGGSAPVHNDGVQMPSHTDQGRLQINPARLRGATSARVSSTSLPRGSPGLLASRCIKDSQQDRVLTNRSPAITRSGTTVFVQSHGEDSEYLFTAKIKENRYLISSPRPLRDPTRNVGRETMVLPGARLFWIWRVRTLAATSCDRS